MSSSSPRTVLSLKCKFRNYCRNILLVLSLWKTAAMHCMQLISQYCSASTMHIILNGCLWCLNLHEHLSADNYYFIFIYTNYQHQLPSSNGLPGKFRFYFHYIDSKLTTEYKSPTYHLYLLPLSVLFLQASTHPTDYQYLKASVALQRHI